MLELTEDLFLGKGRHKATYLHPEDNTKCVKIQFDKRPKELEQLQREIKHNLALQKKHSYLPEIAKYRGTVETNLGTGYIWDIVRDADGSVSIPLDQYIMAGEFLKDDGEDLKRMLRELSSSMLEKGIIPENVDAYNLFCQRDEKGKISLVIVDNLGSAAFFPLEYYFAFAAKSKIKRRWNRSLEGNMKTLHDSEVYRKVLREVRI